MGEGEKERTNQTVDTAHEKLHAAGLSFTTSSLLLPEAFLTYTLNSVFGELRRQFHMRRSIH